jgi:hypothetical protein
MDYRDGNMPKAFPYRHGDPVPILTRPSSTVIMTRSIRRVVDELKWADWNEDAGLWCTWRLLPLPPTVFSRAGQSFIDWRKKQSRWAYLNQWSRSPFLGKVNRQTGQLANFIYIIAGADGISSFARSCRSGRTRR